MGFYDVRETAEGAIYVTNEYNQLLEENTAYKSQLDVYDQAYQKVMTLRKPK